MFDDTNFERRTQLHDACENGDVIIVLFLLCDYQTDLDARDYEGRTALHLACKYGHLEIAGMLASRVYDLDETDNDDRTPLHLACLYGHLDIVQMLLELGADVEKEEDWGLTPFSVAFHEGQVEVVRLFLDLGVEDVNAENKQGWTLLHQAAAVGSIDLAQLLLDRGANVDAKGGKKCGYTPLHVASMTRNAGGFETVRLLLDQGADVNTPGEGTGFTALHNACEKDDSRVAGLLLDRGADVEAKTKWNDTPLLLACQKGRLEVVWLLVHRYPWLILNKLNR